MKKKYVEIVGKKYKNGEEITVDHSGIAVWCVTLVTQETEQKLVLETEEKYLENGCLEKMN